MNRAGRSVMDVDLVRWLASPEGRRAIDGIALPSAGPSPADIQRWRARYGGDRASAALTQAALRAKARVKFTRADRMLFDAEGLEQATGEVLARHKAKRLEGVGRIVDLCCGIGGDAMALAEKGELVLLDRDPSRVAIAMHNVRVYVDSASLEGICADVTERRPAGDAFHIDPSRRAGGRRRHGVDEADPPRSFLRQLVREEPAVAVKLSPAADFAAIDDLEAEIEVISEAGECKQAVAWCGRLRRGLRRATLLPAGEQIAVDDARGLAPPDLRELRAGDILVEPDAAIIRSGLVGEFARRQGLYGIEPRLAYLAGERPVERAFGISLRVMEVGAWSLPAVRRRLRAMDVGRLDIKTRGFAARPEELARRLKTAGNSHAVLVVTRIAGRPTFAIGRHIGD